MGIDVVVIIGTLTWVTAQGTSAAAFKSHHACLTCARLADEANGVFYFLNEVTSDCQGECMKKLCFKTEKCQHLSDLVFNVLMMSFVKMPIMLPCASLLI